MSSARRVRHLVGCLILMGIPTISWTDTPERAIDDKEKNASAKVDLHGDPLPDGALARMGTMRFRGAESITSMAFSPDGTILAAAGSERDRKALIQFWDVGTGKQRLTIKGGINSNWSFTHVAFSPDGKALAVAGRAEHHLWDAETGKEIPRFKAIPYSIASLVFSPDGKTFLTVSEEGGAVQLWDFGTGKQLRQFQWIKGGNKDHEKPDDVDRASKSIIDLVFGKDTFKETLALFSSDGKNVSAWASKNDTGESRVRIWEMESGKQIRQVTDMPLTISGPFHSATGNVVVLDDINTSSILEGATGKEISMVRSPKRRILSWAAVSPDGKLAALSWFDGSSQVIESATGKELRQLERPIAYGALSFTVDGKTLAVADYDKNVIQLIDLATGKDRTPFAGHDDSVVAMHLSPDGKTLATASPDRTLRLWNTGTGEEITRFPLVVETIKRLRLRFSPNGKVLAAGATGIIRSWDAASGKELHKYSFEETEIFDMAFSPNGRILAAALQDGSVHQWDALSGKEMGRLQPFEQDSGNDTKDEENESPHVAGISFSSDGKTLALIAPILSKAQPDRKDQSPNRTNAVRLWEVATGKERRGLPLMHQAIRGTEYRVRFFRNQAQASRVVTPDQADPLIFDPDGKSLVMARYGANSIGFKIVDAAKGGIMLELADNDGSKMNYGIWRQSFAGGSDESFTAVFSADGRYLAGGAADGVIRVWEIATGRMVCRFTGHKGTITSLVFSSDGRTLFSGSDDTTVLAWDMAQGMKDFPPSKLTVLPRKATVQAAPTALPPEKLEALWTELATEDASKVDGALLALESASKDSVPFFKKNLQSKVIVSDPKRIDRLISQLDSAQPLTRDKAMEDLEKLERVAESALRKTLEANPPSLEARRRVERLLEKLEHPYTSPDALRATRVIEVLERIGTPEAREVIENLARGTPEAELTRDAKGALDRLNRSRATRPVPLPHK